MSLGPIADGVLSAFFGSFLGAALGKDMAALTVNLVSSGLEGLGVNAVDHLRSRGNHDLEKLIIASFAKATQKTLRKVDASGKLKFWRDDQNEALSQLKDELAQVLASGHEDESSQLIEAILLGRPDRVEAGLRSFVEPRLAVRLAEWKRQEPEKWQELCVEVSRQFLPHFQELYKSEHYAAGRLAFERDIAWATQQSLCDQEMILSDLAHKQRAALENIKNRLDDIAKGQSSVPDWTPYFENVVSEIKGAESRIITQLDHLDKSTDQLRIGIEHLSLAAQIETGPVATDDEREAIPDDIAAELARGDTLNAECRYTEAAIAYESALKLAENAGHKRAVVKSMVEIGEALVRDSYTQDRAREVLNTCLLSLKESPDPKSRCIVLHLLGHIDLCQGRIQEGRASCEEALKGIQALGDDNLQTLFLIDKAHVEERIGNLAEAHKLLDKVSGKLRVEYRESTGRDKIRAGINLAGSLTMKAHVFEHGAMVDEMLSVLSEAETLSREVKHSDTLANTLVSKTKALFAKSRWEEGLAAIKEAQTLFESLGNIHGVLECSDMRARQAFQMGNQKLALEVCLKAVSTANESGSPADAVKVNGQMAALLRRNDLREEAKAFHEEAMRMAKEHDLADELVHLLLDQADEMRDGDPSGEDSEEGKQIVREALALLKKLLIGCEIKGRRAVYLNRIGSLYGRLKNLTEAKLRFEQSLRIFQEIGDTHGIADSLAYLAAIARERGERMDAIQLLEKVLQVIQDKPLYHFHAGVNHDLVILKMSQGDLQGARRHFDEAHAICANHPMPDVYKVLQETQIRLEFAERSRNSTPSDIWQMVRELRDWVDRFPDARDAILPCWYHFYSPDLWSNLRTQFGVKFLVCARTVKQFESFVTSWAHLGDIFVYAASANIRSERGIDLFPWKSDHIPKQMPCVFLKGPEGKPVEGQEGARAIISALQEMPYFLTFFSGKVEGYPDSEAFIVGRRYRLAPEISGFMLGNDADSLISLKSLIVPVREHDKERSFVHDMFVAWENEMIPVLFEPLPRQKELSLLRTIHFSFPVTLNGAQDMHRSLRTFMIEISKNYDAALAKLVDSLKVVLGHESERTLELNILRFKAGTADAIHPVMILNTEEFQE